MNYADKRTREAGKRMQAEADFFWPEKQHPDPAIRTGVP